MVLGTSQRIISLSKEEPDIMSESNKCCECNQGELPCTCKCHSTTPSYDSWEKEFDAVFGSYQNGPPNSIPDTTKHQDFTGENVKVFIQVLLDRQQAEAVALGETLRVEEIKNAPVEYYTAQCATNRTITTYQKALEALN